MSKLCRYMHNSSCLLDFYYGKTMWTETRGFSTLLLRVSMAHFQPGMQWQKLLLTTGMLCGQFAFKDNLHIVYDVDGKLAILLAMSLIALSVCILTEIPLNKKDTSRLKSLIKQCSDVPEVSQDLFYDHNVALSTCGVCFATALAKLLLQCWFGALKDDTCKVLDDQVAHNVLVIKHGVLLGMFIMQLYCVAMILVAVNRWLHSDMRIVCANEMGQQVTLSKMYVVCDGYKERPFVKCCVCAAAIAVVYQGVYACDAYARDIACHESDRGNMRYDLSRLVQTLLVYASSCSVLAYGALCLCQEPTWMQAVNRFIGMVAEIPLCVNNSLSSVHTLVINPTQHVCSYFYVALHVGCLHHGAKFGYWLLCELPATEMVVLLREDQAKYSLLSLLPERQTVVSGYDMFCVITLTITLLFVADIVGNYKNLIKRSSSELDDAFAKECVNVCILNLHVPGAACGVAGLVITKWFALGGLQSVIRFYQYVVDRPLLNAAKSVEQVIEATKYSSTSGGWMDFFVALAAQVEVGRTAGPNVDYGERVVLLVLLGTLCLLTLFVVIFGTQIILEKLLAIMASMSNTDITTQRALYMKSAVLVFGCGSLQEIIVTAIMCLAAIPAV